MVVKVVVVVVTTGLEVVKVRLETVVRVRWKTKGSRGGTEERMERAQTVLLVLQPPIEGRLGPSSYFRERM